MYKRGIIFGLAAAAVLMATWGMAQDDATSPERSQQIRERYEQALARTPMQDSAFDRVYKSYLETDGIDAWVTKLTPTEGEPSKEAYVLLGRIQERQFKTDDAIVSLEKAKELGVADPQLDLLLGRLYYENGQDDRAATLLTAALEQPIAPEARSGVVRILGNLYLRQGKRDEAIAAWKRLAEDNPGDTFAQTELAEIYEDNRMWEEAVAAYTQLADASANDPYQKCRALRAIGRARLAMESYPEAIAAFEQALDLVSPGNWLFEDLKLRLVGVYQDLGDLAGLATYINEKLAASPGDTEFRDLLAETYTRMTKFAEAEAEYKLILERDPARVSTHERLITLYERMERTEEVIATYDSLIEHYPTEPDYLRRLGEVHLRKSAPDLAKAAWRRILDATPTAGQHAQLAEWLEMYEFAGEAATEYEAALAMGPNKEWTFKLAALKHANGEEDVAKALWTSVLKEDSPAGERAEVASILETFNFKVDAEPLLAQAHAQEPDNLEFAHALAKNLMEQEKYDAAVPLFQQMAEQSENEYFQDRGEGGLLDAYSKLGILAEKKQEWEDAVVASPEDTGLLMRLARMYGRSGDNTSALGLFERCVELSPEDPNYLKTLADAYARENRTEEAIDLYRTLIEKDPNRAGGYYRELLTIYLKADFKEEAIETAKKIVEMSPSDAESYLSLGQVYMNYQQYDEGLSAYRSALRLSPDEPDYYRQYGQALQSQERIGEAQEAYRKMLDTAKEDETRLQAVSSLAQIYMQQGKVDSLLTEFQNRVRNTPKRLAAYQELGAIYIQSGDTARSLEVLENGFNTVDDKAEALKALVRASYESQDFEKVVRYFEELITLSGKATAFEYERLGQVYAQLGDLDKARSTWQRIVDEDKENPKAYLAYAKALRQGGFVEEAAAATEAALEKDPYNFSLRFEYAQELAGQEDMGKAYEQLQLLLDLGPSEADKEKAKKAEEREKKVEQIQRTQMGYQRAEMFSPNYRPGRNYYYGNSLQRGSFEAIRPQVITTMAGMAENSVGIDEFVAAYKKRVEENPGNEQAQEDLILVYENTNKQEEAQAATEALAALRPNDVEVLDKLAVQYSMNQEVDKALEKLAQIDELQPTRRKSSDFARTYLYYRAERKEEGRALLGKLIEENPTDQMIIYMAINVATQYAEKEALTTMHSKLDLVDPKQRRNIRSNLASAYARCSENAEAITLFEELLFEEDEQDPYAAIPRGRRVRFYTPQVGNNNQNRYYGGSGAYQLRNRGVVSNLDYQRSSALEQLIKLLEDPEEEVILQRVLDEALAYGAAESAAQRDRAWKFGVLLASYYVAKTEFDKGREVLAPFLAAKVDDVSAYNLDNYINEQEEKYDAILANYATLRTVYPGQIRDLLRAEATTLMLASRYDEAADHIRDLARRGTPPNDLVTMIAQLKTEEKPAIAKQLLEEQLSGLQRNSQALALLASIYAEDNEYEKAMDLAREAWEHQARSGSGRGANYYFYGGYYQSSGMSTDTTLQSWFQYAKSAGKADELVSEFEARLEKQPGSISAHEYLASIYSMADQNDKAIDLYKDLAEKRPHFVKAKTALAQLYEQSGKYQEAIALYESFMKSRPGLYSSMSWQVRRLYQRLGKGDELAKMEEDLVKQARTPDQLQNLANQFQNDGEFEKARELYVKIVDMEPGQSYYRAQLAEVLKQMGRDDEALEVFAKWFDSPVMRSQGYIDHYTLSNMVGQYKAAGRLDELKAKNEVTLIDKPADMVAQAVEAHIAMAEHRFDDAIAAFFEAMKARQDGNTVNFLLEIGEYQGDAIGMVERMEKESMFQNFWDHQRLAQIYIAADQRDKALESWRLFAEQQGGTWGLRYAMEGLYNFGLFAEAEEFYMKNRKKTRDMDGIAMNMYMEGNGLTGLVQEMLNQEIKGQAESLVDNIIRDEKTSYEAALDLLGPLLEREPENSFLLNSIVQLHERNNKFAEALPWCEKALAVNSHDAAARQRYASLLAKSNREEEAFKLYDDLLSEKVNAENVTAAISFFLTQGHLIRAKAVRDEAASLDARDLDKIDKQIARFEAGRGRARAYADQLKASFEAEKNDENFGAYLSYLIEAGYGEEAWQLCRAEADSGLLNDNALRRGDLFGTAVQYGSLDEIVELLWKFVRHADRWNRENQLQQFVEGFKNLGYGRAMVDAFRDQALAETPPSDVMLLALAQRYEQNGDRLSALSVMDYLLAGQPDRRAWLERKAQILTSMKRFDEALAVRSAIRGYADLRSEASDQINLVGMYLAAGRDADAQATIDALTAWNKSSQTTAGIGNALVAQDRHAEALPYLEAAMRDGNYRQQGGMALVQCYLKTGNTEKARACWQENRRMREMRYFYRSMDDDLYLPIAHDVLEDRIKAFPPELDSYMMLARVRFKQGDAAGAREAYLRAAAAVPAPRIIEAVAAYGTLLASEDRLDPLMDSPPLDEPLMIRAMAAAYRYLPESKRSDALRDKVLALPLTETQDIIDLAAFFHEKDDKPTAIAQWQRALATEGITGEQQIQVLQGLAEAEALEDAATPVRALLQKEPSLLRANPEILAFIAKAGGPELLAEAMTMVRERLPEDDSVNFYEKLATYYAGDRADLSIPKAFLEGAVLIEWQWRHLAKLFKDAGDKTAEVAALRQIADGGFGMSNRDRALAELCVIEAEAGRATEAFAGYLLISPGYGDREGLLETIAKHTTPEHVAGMQAAVDQARAARPGNLMAPTWMGEVAELAEFAGAPLDLATWITQASLSPARQQDALEWTGLIEDWLVSPRVSVSKPQEFMKEERTKVELTAEGAPLDSSAWTPLDPQHTLGIVNLGGALFPNESDFEEAGAFAYTTIEAPAAGPVDLGFATILPSAQVWLNGALIHTANRQNQVLPGIERFRATLNAGSNHVVVKSTNNNKRWLFCLGIVQPAAPLPTPAPAETIEAPAAASPALAAAG